MTSLEDFSSHKIILDERKLSNEYIPTVLPHREEHLKKTIETLKPIFQGEENIVRILIYNGPIGTGKTAVARSIGNKLIEYARKNKIPPIAVSYINGQEFKSKFQVLRKIGSDLGLNIPRRGFSTQEVMEYILNFLNRNNYNLYLILDEADVTVKQREGNEIFYMVTRLNEIYGEQRLGLGTVIIFRNYYQNIDILDKAVISSLNAPIIEFDPYTSSELETILWSRIEKEKAMRAEAVNDEIISMIADTVGYDVKKKTGSGDARMAIKILYFSAKKAESEGRTYILPDDVRSVINRGVLPTVYDKDILSRLSLHEKIILLAITRTLRLEKEKAYVNMGVVKLEYEDLCNKYRIEPLGHTSVWERIQRLKTLDLIETKVAKGTSRGRTTRIQIPEKIGINRVPLDLLENILEELIEKDLSRRG
ncbi:MAG: hypothetical protein DRJ35_04580 [Thermoprotei archaeon]|nr:MAG: hypothetical protein DRJ35_04580 [Thermoprotei archaeon]